MAKNPHLKSMRRTTDTEYNSVSKLFPNWSMLSVEFLQTCTRMDPSTRPTADELLKHSYFTNDRFPEKFLPALREKVRVEFNENPLLRRFKADIFLHCTERREEIRPRRAPVETTRWRINLIQGSVKRKFSSETIHSEDARSLISLSKSSQKLTNNIPRLPSQISKINSIHVIKTENNIMKREDAANLLCKREESTIRKDDIISMKKDDTSSKKEEKPSHLSSESKITANSLLVPKIDSRSDTSKYSSRDSNPRLEKALDLLSKLNKKNQYCRPKSTNKDLYHYSNLPTSPQEFQSLQSHSFREISKSPLSLHPSVQTIQYQNRDLKKSPTIIPNVNNLSLKSVFSQVPVVNPPKTHLLKKLDRYIINENAQNTEPPKHQPSPDWMSSVGVAQKKRDPWKTKTDDFTLPIVPGGKLSSLFYFLPGNHFEFYFFYIYQVV